MAFLELCLYVTEPIKEYIFLLISIQYALQKRKFRAAVNSVHLQRIPATRLISQHFESDFVKQGVSSRPINAFYDHGRYGIGRRSLWTGFDGSVALDAVRPENGRL